MGPTVELMAGCPWRRSVGVEAGQDGVGDLGDGGAEAEALREVAGGVDGDGGHGVDGAQPAVDGLPGVADQDELGVGLVGHDVGQDGGEVLGLVDQDDVGGDAGPGELVGLEVVVVAVGEPAVRGRTGRPRPGAGRGRSRRGRHGCWPSPAGWGLRGGRCRRCRGRGVRPVRGRR